MATMNDEQLLRYSRQILLPEIDIPGQEKLLRSRVLIVGAGGLGSPTALYLAGSGVGHLDINDHDTVDLSNLHRQILHGMGDVGLHKTDSAAASLRELNSDCRITTLDRRLEDEALLAAIARVDLVIDACDNFPTRYRINAACATARKPLVSGAVIRMEGQASVFRHDREDSPCFECLYDRHAQDAEGGGCSDQGILAPVAGIVGTIMATEAIKVLLSLPGTLSGRLLLVDAARMCFRTLSLHRDPACPVCAMRPAAAV